MTLYQQNYNVNDVSDDRIEITPLCHLIVFEFK